MTDQINHSTSDDIVETPDASGTSRGRRMFLTGAGIAGAAALVGKAGTASAADNAPVLVGNPNNETNDGATVITNTNTTATNPGTAGQEAVLGELTGPGNGSHAVRGITAGRGHGVAGENTLRDNTVGATWGRHSGLGAGISGVNIAEDVPVAGTARGVEGIITQASNGSHSVFGITAGGGHAIAGVIGSADADGNITVQDDTVAATWGRHYGNAAATEGQSLAEGVAIAGPANGVKGIVEKADNGSHAVLGITNGGGHSIAGDTPADAKGPGGVGPNTTAATWGRHGGAGAGIGGINTGNGYGGEFIGGKSHVRLIQSEDANDSGPPSGAGHLLGELYADGAGNLWYNTANGNNWVSINRPTGSTVLFSDGQRAFDSRSDKAPASAKGRIAANETVEIDLTEFTDFQPGYQGALLNITVEQPSPGISGFATVFNGDTADRDRPDTSSINWGRNTDVVANAATVRTGASGTIKVFARQDTHLIIDVVGYLA
jgi:hypothetical protein